MSEKWWDMSDDELDDLFREASDKVEVPFDSSAYNKLRQKIAEQPMSGSSNGFKKRWLFVLAGLFLMVGVGLVYRFGDDLKKDNSTEITVNIEKKNTVKPLNVPSTDFPKKNQNRSAGLLKLENLTNKKTISSAEKETTVEKSKLPSSAIPKTMSEVKRVTKKPALSSFASIQTTLKANPLGSSVKIQLTADEKKSLDESSTKTKIKTDNLDKSSVEIRTTTNIQKTTETPIIIEEKKSIENNNLNSDITENQLFTKNNLKNRIDKNRKNIVTIPISIGENISPIIENSIIIQEKGTVGETINKTNFYGVDLLKNKDLKLLLTNIRADLPYYVDSLPSNIKPVKLSKFGFRFVLSPDLNSIENLGKMALGGSIGLLFEYKISKKLLIQTGMVYSSKNYVGSFDDYHNWKDWRGYHPSKPTEVDGGCKVFDIPINLRLNLFEKPKQTWFVSSGISSYWMMNENYTYNYAWNSPRAVDWSDNSKYYFSVLNFSVGLERQISKRFSFQIEPYLKTPLKNVGRGGVNLYSSGLLFSTKYSF